MPGLHRFLILFVVSLSSPGWINCSFGQVVAGFTASPTSGCAPLLVSFTNTTTPVIGTTYVWDFGNGTPPVTLTNPSTSYFSAGTYTVTLTATNGSSSNTASRVITVYPTPAISFSASDTAVCPGVPLTFTSTTVAGTTGHMTLLWSTGDGYTDTSTTFTHAYALSGHFNITLNATNSMGCSSSLTRTAYIHIYTPPPPTFTASTRHVCGHHGNVTFTPTTSGTPPFSYRWTFGDGSPASTATSPTHLYSAVGSYTVKLVVTDGHGCMDSAAIPGYINVDPLTAAFTYPDSACVNTPVTFVNTSAAWITDKWFFGDGNTSTDTNGLDTYHVRGRDTVMLVVTDSFCHDTVKHVLIIPAPTVRYHISPDTPCPAPTLATFTADVPAGSTVAWNFDDGATGSGLTATHTYLKDTFFFPSMVVTDAIGCTDTVTKTYGIYDLILFRPYTMAFGGCIPVSLNFSVDVRSNIPVLMSGLSDYPYHVTYNWHFADGSPDDTNAAPTHTFTAVGTYDVTVTVTSANGCVRVLHDSVLAGSRPHATFTATDRHQCYHDNQVYFTRTLVSGPVDGYYWLFGEGLYGYRIDDTTSLPVYTIDHHFEIPGLFSDTLISYYHLCPDTFIRTHYVQIDSPMSRSTRQYFCSPPKTVKFQNGSLGDDTHLWIFGDGTTSALDTVTHTFPSPTIYNAMLTTYDSVSGCHDTEKIYLDLTRLALNISASDTAICRDDFTILSSSISSGYVSFYNWYVGSGGSPVSLGSSFADTFHTTGRYTVRLIATDQHGCPDTVTKTNYILVAKPIANFMVSPSVVCLPGGTVFTDASTDQPGTFFTSHYWSFGDVSTATTTSSSISHVYPATGTYSTTEIVTDNVGCKDTVTHALVSVYKATANFAASNTHPCPYTGVTFYNYSSAGTTSFWTFGDGTTSFAASPIHYYADTGHFTVRLVVTDSHGCHDTMTRSSYIIITKPHAAFTMSDSVSVCPPFTVHFLNASSGGTNFWIFGDGNASIATDPTDIYATPGYFAVKLVVTDTLGCHDTALHHVKVYGYSGAFSYSADSGCAPLTIHFNADLSNISLATGIYWDFSDGIVSSVSLIDTITHTYLHAGAFLPKLIITDHLGCTSSSLGSDTIKVDTVGAGFKIVPASACVNDTIVLHDTSKSYWSHITQHQWVYIGTTSLLDSPHITYAAGGVYTDSLRVTDAWGCTGSAVRTVTVNPLPDAGVITISPLLAFCIGYTTKLFDTAAGGVWSLSNSHVSLSNDSLTGVSPGTDTVFYTVTNACGSSKAMLTVNVLPPVPPIDGPTKVCVGDTIYLTDSNLLGSFQSGDPDVYVYTTISDTGLVVGKSVGTAVITYHVDLGCNATTTITINPLPDAGTITGIDSVCKNAVVMLQDSITGGRWSVAPPGIATVDSLKGGVISLAPGTAYILYTVPPNIYGCVNTDTFRLTVLPTANFVIQATISPPKCYGDTGSIAAVVLNSSGYVSYSWSTGDTLRNAWGLQPGTYTIKVKDQETQCIDSVNVQLVQPDSIQAIFEITKSTCRTNSGSIKVTAKGGTTPYSYLWSNNSTASEITNIPTETYSLTLTDSNGCHKQFAERVEDTCTSIIIFNGISPNGDGINDTWVIEGIDAFPNNEVKVFDKWGDLVFEEKNYKNDWAGKGKKGELPDGTYYYLVKLNTPHPPDGKGDYTGSLLIKR